MKLTTVLLLVFCMQIYATGYSQKITLAEKSTSLVKIFQQIKKQSSYTFWYEDKLVKDINPISISIQDATLAQTLDRVLATLPLTYEIIGKTVVLKEKQAVNVILSEVTPPIIITGKVTNSKGEALVGITVLIKGTTKGVITDITGNYSLKITANNKILVFSSVGMKRQEITIANRTVINVVMEAEVALLEGVQVVSTGYQKISKERVTGSFFTISAKKLQEQRLSDLSTLLEGRIPGYNNGLIRGTTSMNGNTSPLYVIDEVPVEFSPNLNLEDIESITVLKDAAAASIYGARAANGVVVITTKKGKIGKPQISASSTFTFTPYHLYNGNLTSAADIVDLEKQWATNNPSLQGAYAADNAKSLLDNAVYTSQGMNALLRYYANPSQGYPNAKLDQLASSGYQYYDDVKKYSKRNPLYQQYNLNIGTATDKNSFYTSVTYRNNSNADKYSKDQSLSLNVSNIVNLTKWLSLELGNYLAYGDATYQSYNTLNPEYSFMPYDRLVNTDGSPFTSTATSRLSSSTMSIINNYGLYSMDITPLDEQQRNLSNSKKFNDRSYIKAKTDITKWLSYSLSFQYEYGTFRNNTLYDKGSYYVRNKVNKFFSFTPSGTAFTLPYGNIYNYQNQNSTNYNFRQQINIDKTFAEKHSLTAILGTETIHSRNESNANTLYNYDPMTLSSEFLSSKPTGGVIGYDYFSNPLMQSDKITRFISVFGNAAYAYDNKYMLTGSLRWDRSSIWGTGSKYQNKPVWSLGAGWNIHKESFLKVDWINLLKLRTSYGIGGNIPVNNAPYMVAYYYENSTVGGIQGSIASRPNPLLSWEKTTTTNIGLDFAILNNRLSGSLDYYHKKGVDLLANTMGVPTEGFGYSTYQINNGEMLNQGIEVLLSAYIIRNKDLTWNTTIQYAHNRNKVTYVNVEAPVYYLQLDYPSAYPRISNPFNAIYAYRWAGLTHDKGLPQVFDEKGKKVTYNPGSLNSIVYCGTTVPKYSGSFNSSLSYKNLSFTFLLTFEGGHKVRNTLLPMLSNGYNSSTYSYQPVIGMVNKDIINRWKVPGDETKTQIPSAMFEYDSDFSNDSYDIYRYADINVLNASNIRLRNISLAYTLPQNLSKKAGMESIRLQFNVENVFMIASSKDAKYLLGGYQSPNYVGGIYLSF